MNAYCHKLPSANPLTVPPSRTSSSASGQRSNIARAAAGILGLAMSSAAVAGLQTAVSVHLIEARETCFKNTALADTCSASASGTGTYGRPYAESASAWVDAQFGVYKMAGWASTAGQGQSSARSQVTLHDTLSFGYAPLSGQPALWSTSVLITGTADASNNAASAFDGQGRTRWEFQIYGAGGTDYFRAIYDETAFDFDTTFVNSDVNGTGGANPYGLFPVLIPFTLGTPFSVNHLFSALAYGLGAREGVNSGGSYALDQSVYWGGLGTITTASGEDITAMVTLSSANNFAWGQSFIPTSSVSEPPSLALLILSLGVFAAIRRSRIRSRGD